MAICRRLLVLATLALWACAASGGEVLWAEGEAWAAQRGSMGSDRPPFGSRGACLGTGWGGSKGHYAVYRFRLSKPMANARLIVRYARKDTGDSLVSVALDRRVIAAKATLKNTGGWGHVRDDEWATHTFGLGNLPAGNHELRLTSLADKNNVNIDGFFLASGDFAPPKSRKQIERVQRLTVRASMLARPAHIDPSLSIEGFSPMYHDLYYPPEEAKERAGLALPRSADTVPDGWERVGTTSLHGKPVTVMERHFAHWGILAYVGADGVVTTIRKAVGNIAQIGEPAGKFPPGYEDAILKSKPDLLGNKVLRRKGDPTFEACAAFLPDVDAYTFLSTEASDHVIAVETDGALGAINYAYGHRRIDKPLFDPAAHLPEHEPTAAKRGNLGGWLPAIDYAFYDAAAKLGWEEIAFAVPDDQTPTKLVLYVYLRVVKADGSTERHTFRVKAGRKKAIGPAELLARLFEFKEHWDATLSGATEIDVPEQRVVDGCRASFALSFVSYAYAAPRYGVGHYGKLQHATFPPTTLSMGNACVEWGLMGHARRYLDYYLDNVVRRDGTFDYYGPAVSEYGQMLDLLARFARRSGDAAWLRARMPKIEAICGHLLALRRDSQAKYPKDDLRHGLVFGSPEADTRKDVNFYYSGDTWTWRGFTEIGRALVAMGDDAMKRRGKELLAECAAYRTDIEASIAKSIVPTTKPVFVPPVAGFDKPFATMTESRFASYTNYRYWLEMLSAGFLRPEWHDAIVAYRIAHSGELLGTTRFSGHLDDWPFAGYAYGILLRDRVRPFILGLYGDLAMHRMRGTFTAYEQVNIRGLTRRPYHADYCVPAQLVVPLMARWMLVFEEPDADVLWLCRATPRRWLAAGKGIAVRRATTRWGTVSFAITPKDDGTLDATIELPKAGLPAELRLRLRAPGGKPIGRVTLNGKPHTDIDAKGEFVRIARPKARTLRLSVSFAE